MCAQALDQAPRRPRGVQLAAALLGIEGAVFLVLMVWEMVDTSRGRAVMTYTTALFFLMYGGFLLASARAILQLNIWWRAPVVMSQLIQMLVAREFWGGETRWLALVLVLAAVATMAGVLAPASTRAFERRS